MAVIETWLRQDLKGLVTVRSLQGQVFSLDNGGNLIGVKVTKDGRPVTLTGTVTGYCILSDGQTVTVTGSGSSGIQNENEAYIVLPQLVYSVPGQISIVIKLTSGSVTTTLAACTGYVYRSRTSNEVVPPGTPIPDLATMEEVIRRATAATDAANAATVGAEKVDASMTKEGDVITIAVTDRDGNVTEKTVTDQTEAMKQKADINGIYPELTSGTAEQLISTQYVENAEAYKHRATGGSADVGNREYLEKIIGGTVCWNQLVHDECMNDANAWTIGSMNGAASGGVLTLTGAGTDLARSAIIKPAYLDIIYDNRVYLFSVDMISNRDDSIWHAAMDRSSATQANRLLTNASIPTSWQRFSTVIKFVSHEGRVAGIRFGAPATSMDDGDYISLKNLMLIDLTAMFGPTIADYVYGLETATPGAGVAWFRKYFPNDYYEHNPGELISVSGLQSHDTVGFNAWDEVTEIGSINTSGAETSTAGYYRTKNYIRVIGGTNYYFKLPVQMNIFWYDCDKTFVSYSSALNQVKTAPDNACYLRFRNSIANSWVPSDTDDICINLSHSGTRNGEYEPYEKHSYPLDSSLTLRGMPKLNENSNLYFDGDEYPTDGQVSRKYGIVDLGTLKWGYDTQGTNPIFFTNDIASFAKTENFTIRIICNKYTALPSNSRTLFREGSQNKDMMLTSKGMVGTICVRDDAYTDATSFKTAMSGVMLVYELATPTTEQAEPYTEIQICNDWGTEEFVSDSILPVGHLTRYPANLRDKLQHLPSLVDADGDYIVRQTGSQMSLVGIGDTTEVTGIKTDISELKASSAKGIYIETESTPVISISDGADGMPMRKIEVAIEPVQDLHGYDAPWPSGGGKNLLKNNLTSKTQNGITVSVDDFGVITITGIASANTSFTINSSVGIGPGSYVVNGITSPSALSYKLEAQIDGHWGNNFISGDNAVTASTGITSIVLYIYSGTAFTTAAVIKPMIRKATDTDGTFAPYSNICPISGWTGAKVTRCRKNLFQTTAESGTKKGTTFTVNDDGSVTISGTPSVSISTYTFGVVDLPAGSYKVNGLSGGGHSILRMVCYNDNTKSSIITSIHSGADVEFTLDSPTTVRLYPIVFTTFDGAPTTFYPMIRVASETDSTFEPYQGQTYEVTFPSEAGTVYGGTLDVVSGKLVVDRAVVDLGSLTWTQRTATPSAYYKPLPDADDTLGGITVVAEALASMPNANAWSNITAYPDNSICVKNNSGSTPQLIVMDSTVSTASDLAQKLTGVKCVYKLSAPQEYTLTEQQITTLLGQNNIFADTGNVSVDYPADTKMYIDNRINSTRKLIAGIETGFVASKAYAVGDMLIIGDDLYKVASAIASGATITVGTNVTKTTVAEQLIALANA